MQDASSSIPSFSKVDGSKSNPLSPPKRLQKEPLKKGEEGAFKKVLSQSDRPSEPKKKTETRKSIYDHSRQEEPVENTKGVASKQNLPIEGEAEETPQMYQESENISLSPEEKLLEDAEKALPGVISGQIQNTENVPETVKKSKAPKQKNFPLSEAEDKAVEKGKMDASTKEEGLLSKNELKKTHQADLKNLENLSSPNLASSKKLKDRDEQENIQGKEKALSSAKEKKLSKTSQEHLLPKEEQANFKENRPSRDISKNVEDTLSAPQKSSLTNEMEKLPGNNQKSTLEKGAEKDQKIIAALNEKSTSVSNKESRSEEKELPKEVERTAPAFLSERKKNINQERNYLENKAGEASPKEQRKQTESDDALFTEKQTTKSSSENRRENANIHAKYQGSDKPFDDNTKLPPKEDKKTSSTSTPLNPKILPTKPEKILGEEKETFSQETREATSLKTEKTPVASKTELSTISREDRAFSSLEKKETLSSKEDALLLMKENLASEKDLPKKKENKTLSQKEVPLKEYNRDISLVKREENATTKQSEKNAPLKRHATELHSPKDPSKFENEFSQKNQPLHQAQERKNTEMKGLSLAEGRILDEGRKQDPLKETGRTATPSARKEEPSPLQKRSVEEKANRNLDELPRNKQGISKEIPSSKRVREESNIPTTKINYRESSHQERTTLHSGTESKRNNYNVRQEIKDLPSTPRNDLKAPGNKTVEQRTSRAPSSRRESNLPKMERKTEEVKHKDTYTTSFAERRMERPEKRISSKKQEKPPEMKEQTEKEEVFLAQKYSPIKNMEGMQGQLSESFETSFINEEVQAPINRENLQELIERMIDKIYTMRSQGETNTTVTIKNLPMFEDATITIKEFDTAKGEFNISFANLTNQAKEILDRQQNQELLKQTLLDKGYTVHIITTNTETEIASFEAKAYDREEEGQQKGQDEKEERQDKKKKNK